MNKYNDDKIIKDVLDELYATSAHSDVFAKWLLEYYFDYFPIPANIYLELRQANEHRPYLFLFLDSISDDFPIKKQLSNKEVSIKWNVDYDKFMNGERLFTNYRANFHQYISILFKTGRIKQRWVADQLNISPLALNRWQVNRFPSFDLLIKYCQLVSLDTTQINEIVWAYLRTKIDEDICKAMRYLNLLIA